MELPYFFNVIFIFNLFSKIKLIILQSRIHIYTLIIKINLLSNVIILILQFLFIFYLIKLLLTHKIKFFIII